MFLTPKQSNKIQTKLRADCLFTYIAATGSIITAAKISECHALYIFSKHVLLNFYSVHIRRSTLFNNSYLFIQKSF
jgi:hypothetical protein